MNPRPVDESRKPETPASAGATYTLIMGAFLGTTAGASFTLFEIVQVARTEKPAFALAAALVYMSIGAAMAGAVALGTWLVLRLIRSGFTRQAMAALLTGFTVQGLLLMCLSRSGMLITLPLPWLAAALVLRDVSEWKPWRLRAVLLSLSLGLIACAWGVAYARISASGMAVFAAVILGALSATALLLLGSLKFPRITTGTGLVLLLGLGLLTFVQWQQPLSALAGAPRLVGTPTNSVPPNVVLIVLDTLRRDHLGCYGHTGGLTPVLDQLASEGVLYEDAYSTAPWTVPSHASMFTGLYSKSHGCSSADHLWLDAETPTLADLLRAEGYDTVSLVSNGTVDLANLAQGFDKHIHMNRADNHRRLAITETIEQIGFPDRWADKGTVETAIDLHAWLQNRKGSDKPFFLFVNVMEPHQPYEPPLDHRLEHLPKGCGFREATRIGSVEFDGTKWHVRGPGTDRRAEIARALYRAEVAYQDESLKSVIDVLGSQVPLDNTLLIVTADHGENLGEGRRWGHLFALNDHLIHVPLVVRYPAQFPSGTRVAGFCQLIDLLPTVFDVLGKPCPVPNLPGKTLVPARFTAREEVFAAWEPQHWSLRTIAETLGARGFTDNYNAQRRAIRTRKHKYIWASDGRHRLYDVENDPDELFDLITERPEVARDLHARLQSWWDALPDYVPPAGDDPAPLDPDTIEALKSLGYIGK